MCIITGLRIGNHNSKLGIGRKFRLGLEDRGTDLNSQVWFTVSNGQDGKAVGKIFGPNRKGLYSGSITDVTISLLPKSYSHLLNCDNGTYILHTFRGSNEPFPG